MTDTQNIIHIINSTVSNTVISVSTSPNFLDNASNNGGNCKKTEEVSPTSINNQEADTIVNGN